VAPVVLAVVPVVAAAGVGSVHTPCFVSVRKRTWRVFFLSPRLQSSIKKKCSTNYGISKFFLILMVQL
jgi:hypothetical protein